MSRAHVPQSNAQLCTRANPSIGGCTFVLQSGGNATAHGQTAKGGFVSGPASDRNSLLQFRLLRPPARKKLSPAPTKSQEAGYLVKPGGIR